MSDSRTPEQIREEIEGTRREMGGTVEALAAKTDLKARAGDWAGRKRRRIEEVRDRVVAQVRSAAPESAEDAAGKANDAARQAGEAARRNPAFVTAVAVFLIGFVVGRVRRR